MNESTAEQAPNKSISEVIPLVAPIERGETKIASIQLRKPYANDMNGLSLQDLVRGDVMALMTLIPRISSPIITRHEAGTMDPADLLSCQGVLLDFLAPSLTQAYRSLTE